MYHRVSPISAAPIKVTPVALSSEFILLLPASRAPANPYSPIRPSPAHFATSNAVSSSSTPTAASRKNTTGKEIPKKTAAMSPARCGSSSRLTFLRPIAANPTTSL